MHVRPSRIITLSGILFALLLFSISLPSAFAALTNGQAASLVLGQNSLTANTSGTSNAKIAYPNAVAIDPTTGKVFVVDTNNHRVLRFASYDTLSNGAAAELVLGQPDFTTNTFGTAPDKMYYPTDVALGETGILWVSDTYNSRVLGFNNAVSIDSNGANANIALGQADLYSKDPSVGQNRMNFPRGVTTSAGRVWVSDSGNSRILRFNTGNWVTGANANGRLGQPTFTDYISGLSASRMNAPTGLTFNNNVLWVADTGNHRILRFDTPETSGDSADGVLGQSNFTSNGTATSQAGLNTPHGVAIDSAGTLWVSDTSNHRILRFDAAETKSNGANADDVLGQDNFTSNTVATSVSASNFNLPRGIALSGTDQLWVADRENHRVLFFSEPITWNTPAAITYGTALSSTQLNATSNIAGTFSYSSPIGTVLPAGTHIITATLTPSDTSVAPIEKAITLTVNKAPLTITAKNATRIYGVPTPPIGADVVGFVNGDTVSVLQGTFYTGTNAATDSPPGSYVIQPYGLTAANYTITYVNAVLTVTKAPLTVKAKAVSRTYGAANPSFVAEYTGLNNNETASVLGGSISFSTTATAGSSVGTYAIVPNSSLSSSNYTITVENGTLTVTKAPLTITAKNASRIYGVPPPPIGADVDGYVNGDNASIFSGTFYTGTNAATDSPPGSYIIQPYGLTAANYAITYVNSVLTVTKAPLTITANDATRAVGAANPSFSVTYSGLNNNETAAVLGGTLKFTTTANASSPIDSYPIVPSGLTSSNYDITFVNGTLTVQKAQMSVIYLPTIVR